MPRNVGDDDLFTSSTMTFGDDIAVHSDTYRTPQTIGKPAENAFCKRCASI